MRACKALALLLCVAATGASADGHVGPLDGARAASLHRRVQRNGFARLPGLLPRDEALYWRERVVAASSRERAECLACSPEALASIGAGAGPCRSCDVSARRVAAGPGGGGGGKAFSRARRLAEHDPSMESLLRAPALARAAAAALNASRVRLYQASAFVKEAGDGRSAWHQDAAATPLDTDRLATVWVALDDLPEDAGALCFLRGSHLPGVALPPSLRGAELGARLQSMARWTDAEVAAMTGLEVVGCGGGGGGDDDGSDGGGAGGASPARLHMRAGDATVHLGWTLHGARGNKSGRSRPAVAITYFADGARVHPQLLRFEPAGAPNGGHDADGSDLGAVRLSTAGGDTLVVRLLADDASTWTRWLESRPPILVPGQLVRSDVLTPVLWDDAKPELPGASGDSRRAVRGDPLSRHRSAARREL